MADIKQRQAAANQAFFEQKAREYTRETGVQWSAKDVADYFEGTVRELSVYGTDAKAVSRAWEETAEYNGMNAPSADMYPSEDPVKGWNDFKSATSITRDAIQWGINNGAIRGTPSDLKSLNEKIQRSFNNIDSLSALPPGFEEAVSTSNAMLGRTAAPTGGTLDNLLSNRNTPTPPLSNIAPNYNAKQQQRMPAGRQPPAFERQMQSLQAQKTGTNMQRALDMLPRIDPADRIAELQRASSRATLERSLREGAREKRNSILGDAIWSANFSGQLPAIPQSSAIEQLRAQYQTGQAQRFNPGTPNVAASRFAMEAPVNRTTSRTSSLGTTGFSQGSIPQMMPSGAMNVARPGDGTVRAGFNSTVPSAANAGQYALNPQRIADNRTGLRAPEYPRATPLSQPTIDAARFNNVPTAQPNMSANDVRGSYHRGLVQQASVPAPTRTPANTTGANSYFADPRVSGYMPGQSAGLRSVGGKTVGNQFSGMPAVSYASVPASVTWGGMANAAPTNQGFVNAAQVSNRNAEIGRALQEKAATYGTGGPAIDVIPAAATRGVSPRNVDVNQNIQPAPSFNVSVAPNGTSTATQVDQQSLQVGANRGVSKVAELAAKVGPAVAGGIVAGPVGAAIGSFVQNAAQTFFGGAQNRQAQSGGSPAASFSGGGVTANPSGLGSGPVSYSVDPRSGNREVTNTYGVTSTITPEGFTYGGPGGSSGKG